MPNEPVEPTGMSFLTNRDRHCAGGSRARRSADRLMQTVSHIVVFDNNAYGDLRNGRLQGDLNECLRGLTDGEARAGVEARASPTVMAELIASWADSSSPAHAPSAASIEALVCHCTARSGGLGMIADEQSIACNAIFGTVPPPLDANNRCLAGLCRSIAAGRSLTAPEVETVKALRAQVDAQERGFVDSMKQVQRDLGGLRLRPSGAKEDVRRLHEVVRVDPRLRSDGSSSLSDLR